MITRQTAKAMNEDIVNTLSGVARKYNCKIDNRGGAFDATSYKPKLSFVLLADDDGVSIEKKEFETFARLIGLRPDDYGKEFSHNGKRYTAVAIKPSSLKYPLIGVDVNTGKRFKFHGSVLARPLESRV